MVNVNVKKLYEDAKMPERGTADSAGHDLHAYVNDARGEILILPNTTVKVHTGIAMEIPKGYFGAVFPRSGLSTKHGIRLANCVAVIDSDYRGEIMVPLYNDSSESYRCGHGERIAQIIIMPYLPVEYTEGEISNTARGEGGFGSTGRL